MKDKLIYPTCIKQKYMYNILISIQVLYGCKHVEEIWKVIGQYLKMFMHPKYTILSITDAEMNRYLFIVFVL